MKRGNNKKKISGSIWENKKRLQNSFPIFRNFSISINTFGVTHQKILIQYKILFYLFPSKYSIYFFSIQKYSKIQFKLGLFEIQVLFFPVSHFFLFQNKVEIWML